MSYLKYGGQNIYYEKSGSGLPLILLHGDTASSKMFELILPLYQENFTVILIDFLGNGKSDRIKNLQRICGFHKPNKLLHS